MGLVVGREGVVAEEVCVGGVGGGGGGKKGGGATKKSERQSKRLCVVWFIERRVA